MSRRRRRPVITYKTKPIPEPPGRNLGSGLVFMIASFFNNTQSLDIETQSKDSRFVLRYRGSSYTGQHYKPYKEKQ